MCVIEIVLVLYKDNRNDEIIKEYKEVLCPHSSDSASQLKACESVSYHQGVLFPLMAA